MSRVRILAEEGEIPDGPAITRQTLLNHLPNLGRTHEEITNEEKLTRMEEKGQAALEMGKRRCADGSVPRRCASGRN